MTRERKLLLKSLLKQYKQSLRENQDYDIKQIVGDMNSPVYRKMLLEKGFKVVSITNKVDSRGNDFISIILMEQDSSVITARKNDQHTDRALDPQYVKSYLHTMFSRYGDDNAKIYMFLKKHVNNLSIVIGVSHLGGKKYQVRLILTK